MEASFGGPPTLPRGALGTKDCVLSLVAAAASKERGGNEGR